jgi:hypothetical protein
LLHFIKQAATAHSVNGARSEKGKIAIACVKTVEGVGNVLLTHSLFKKGAINAGLRTNEQLAAITGHQPAFGFSSLTNAQ